MIPPILLPIYLSNATSGACVRRQASGRYHVNACICRLCQSNKLSSAVLAVQPPSATVVQNRVSSMSLSLRAVCPSRRCSATTQTRPLWWAFSHREIVMTSLESEEGTPQVPSRIISYSSHRSTSAHKLDTPNYLYYIPRASKASLIFFCVTLR